MTTGAKVPSVEALARALYLTESGSNGYPPSHDTIPWEDISDPTRYERPLAYARAERMLALMEPS